MNFPKCYENNFPQREREKNFVKSRVFPVEPCKMTSLCFCLCHCHILCHFSAVCSVDTHKLSHTHKYTHTHASVRTHAHFNAWCKSISVSGIFHVVAAPFAVRLFDSLCLPPPYLLCLASYLAFVHFWHLLLLFVLLLSNDFSLRQQENSAKTRRVFLWHFQQNGRK